MSILIRGVSMPEDGHIFSLVLKSDGVVIGANDGKVCGKAIELSPHGDLIDRSKIAYTRDDSGLRSMDFARRAQLENVILVIPAEEERNEP